MKNHRKDYLLNDIRHYFGFLIDNGYQIRNVRFLEAFEDWQVVLESPICFIEIYTDRSELSLLFEPDKANREYKVGLETMIYFLTREQVFIGHFEGNLAWGKKRQFERLSSLLKQYHAQIISFFANDFDKSQDDLTASQKKYASLLSQHYSQKFRAEEKRRAWVNLFLLPLGVAWVGLWAYLGWGMSINFVIETAIIAKLMYGLIGLFILIVLALSINWILKSFLRSYRTLKE